MSEEDKIKDREDIEKGLQEFLKRGKKIEVLKPSPVIKSPSVKYKSDEGKCCTPTRQQPVRKK